MARAWVISKQMKRGGVGYYGPGDDPGQVAWIGDKNRAIVFADAGSAEVMRLHVGGHGLVSWQ